MTEKRREPRFPTSFAGELTIAGRTYLGMILDLSPIGAYIELMDRDRFPHEGAAVLASPSFEAPVDVVIRSKRLDRGGVSGLGVEFVAPPASLRARIDQLRAG